mgnify:CR=1 FL=1|jgi:hypothetical protein
MSEEEEEVDKRALSRIYDLSQNCDYVLVKSLIVKEFGQDVWQRHKGGVQKLLKFQGTDERVFL